MSLLSSEHRASKVHTPGQQSLQGALPVLAHHLLVHHLLVALVRLLLRLRLPLLRVVDGRPGLVDGPGQEHRPSPPVK